MACGACGSKRQANSEYEITFRDGSPSRRVATMSEARVLLSQSKQGGTYKMVPKLAK